MMLDALLAAAAAAVATGLLVIGSAPWHGRWTADAQSGIQKQHHGSPPRIGLLPILVGLCVGLLVLGLRMPLDVLRLDLLLLACALPAASMGLLEDLTKKVRARWRLLAPTLGTVAGMVWLGCSIPPLGVPLLDDLLAFWPVAVLVTVLMVVGFTQAMNIVDGLNGLASGLALLMLLATAWAAHGVHDVFITRAALLLAAALLGFWLLNFPRGLMFLGDGGAYFLGFTLAVLWLLLLGRNPGQISVWFVMAVAAHPTMETIFSIVRRRLLRARPKPATAPDRLHLHSLVFRRRTRPLLLPAQRLRHPWAMNAMASAILLAWAIVPMLMASLNPASHSWNLAVLLFSVVGYLVQFYRIAGLKGRRVVRQPASTEAESATVATAAALATAGVDSSFGRSS